MKAAIVTITFALEETTDEERVDYPLFFSEVGENIIESLPADWWKDPIESIHIRSAKVTQVNVEA